MTLSFCITCKGRLHHLRQTFRKNLEWTAGIPGIEFVLLNYTSPDGLEDWVRSEMMEVISAGRLNYYCAHGFAHYNSPHAKNVAHRVAGGEVVCNLDADNFLGAGFAEFLIDAFATQPKIFVRSQNQRSTWGRLAFRKSDFLALGGYDERLKRGWGYDDQDIAARACLAGFTALLIPKDKGFLNAIAHSHTERTRFMEERNPSKSSRENRYLSAGSIASRQWIANASVRWGEAQVTQNFRTNLSIP